MEHRELHRAVARATGESVATIARLGFQPVGEISLEQDPEAYILDWDNVSQARQVALFEQV